ncbi:YadA-like family protein, partial [Spirabiliibacterium falconis]|uniref:YadA-like family protein n=1 Tax=Spirabiliibacterium falconis TaxID=572023 RepID=UPI001AACD499
MNSIFKIIWNQATQSFVVVSELAKGRTKSSTRSPRRMLKLTRIGSALSLILGSSAVMAALPISGTGTTCVVEGLTVACADGSQAVTEGSIAIGDKAIAGMASMETSDSADVTFSGKEAKDMKTNDPDYRYRVGKRNNIAVGSGAEAVGGRVISIGQGAGAGITNNWNTHNVNIGSAAGVRSMGTDNIFLGRNAGGIGLQDTQAPSSNLLPDQKGLQGLGNIVIGTNAGQRAGTRDNPNGYNGNPIDKFTGATGVSENILIGRDAGNNMYKGTSTNVFIGAQAGANHKTLAKEFRAGYRRADGSFASPYSPYVIGLNVGIGGVALTDSEGELNTAAGWKAGWRLSGSNNTAMGYLSQYQLKGDGNAALGPWAGSNANGDKNVAVGSEAGVGITADHTVAVGDTAKGMADHSTAISSLSVAQGESSIAIGRNSYVGDKAAYLAEAGKLSAANSAFDKANTALTNATRDENSKSSTVTRKEGELEREKTALANNQKKLDEENAKPKPSDAAVKLWTQRVSDSTAKIEKITGELEKAKQELTASQAKKQEAQAAFDEKQAKQQEVQTAYTKFMADAAGKYDSAIAMGKNAKAVNTSAIAIGKESEATGMNAIAQGTQANSAGIGSIAIGNATKAKKDASIAVGTNAEAIGKASVAIGEHSVAGREPVDPNNTINQVSTAVGRKSKATGGSSSAFGSGAEATALYSVALGAGSQATGDGAIAAGVQSVASGGQSIAQGRSAQASAIHAIAIGSAAQASGVSSISIGTSNVVSGDNSGAIGDPSFISGTGTYTVGNNNGTEDAKIAGNNAGAFGNNNKALGDNSRIVGNSNTVNNTNTFVMGNSVETTQDNSVVLGNESTDKAAQAINDATVNNLTYGGFAGVGAPANGVVSVGKAGGERQIINVAAGEISATSTDAINGSQLWNVLDKGGITFKNTGSQGESGGEQSNFVKFGDTVTLQGDGDVQVLFDKDSNTFTIASHVEPGLGSFSVDGDNSNALTIDSGNQTLNIKGDDDLIATEADGSDTVNIKATDKLKEAVEKVAENTQNIEGNKTNITNNTNDITELKKGWNVTTSASDGEVAGTTEQNIQAGDTVTVDAGKNIKVTQAGAKITVATKDDLEVTSVTAGDTKLTDNGVVINNGPSITKDGINAGDKKITNVAPGEADTDAVNVSQLKDAVKDAKGKPTSVKAGDTNVSVTKSADKNAEGGDEYVVSMNKDITIGTPAQDGKDGEAGSIGVAGKDGKDGVSIKGDAGDGKPGIGIAGKDGKDGVTLTVKDGEPGVDGKDGVDGKKPRLEVNGEEVATLNDGMKYAGDLGDGAAVKLNKTTELTGNIADGKKADDFVDGNIAVVADQNGDDAKLSLKLAKDLTGLDSATFGPVDPATGKPTDPANTIVISNTDGINAGNKPITNINNGLNTYPDSDAPKNGLVNLDNTNVPNNSAATVGDLRNMGWIVGAPGNSYTDQVKNANQVNFVGAGAAKVTGETKDGIRTITIDVKAPEAGGMNGFDVTANDGDATTINEGNKVNFVDGNNTTVTTTPKDDKSGVDVKVDLADNITVGKDGKDGVDGSIGATGKDGASAVLNGKDGTIGLTGPKGADGKDGASAKIGVKDGAKGLDGNDGKDGESKTRIVYEKPDGSQEEVATLNDGLKFEGNQGGTLDKKLNETVTIKGELANDKDATAANTRVDVEDGNLVVKLAKDITDVSSVTFGDKDADPKAKDVVSIGKDGLNNGGNQITNVASGGDINDPDNATNAANIGDLKKAADAAKTTVSSDDSTVKVVKTTNKDTGADNYDLSVNNQGVVENAQLPVVYTDAKGNKVYKQDNGSFNTKPDGTGTKVEKGDVIASMNNGSNATAPTQLANVGSAIDGKDGKDFAEKLDNAAKDPIGQNSAVNVSDLKNTADALTNKGFGLTDDNGNAVKKPLGDTLKVNGTDGITVTANKDSDGLNIGLGNDITIGKDGKDGSIGVNGADGKPAVAINGKDGGSVVVGGKDGVPGKDGTPGVALNGKDGSIGVAGKDGANADITTNKGPAFLGGKGDDGKDGKDGKDGTRLTYQPKDKDGNPVGKPKQVATMDDGLSFAGDKGDVINKKLNEQLDIKGNADKNAAVTDKNIRVDSENGALIVKMAKMLQDLEGAEFKDENGNTVVVKNGGIVIKAENAPKEKTVSLTKDGLNNGGNKITNVARGTDKTDAVNVEQLEEVKTQAGSGGFNVAANGEGAKKISNGDTVDFINGSNTVVSKVDTPKGTKVKVDLAKDLKGLNSVELKDQAGNTTNVTGNGVTITGTNAAGKPSNVSLTANGLDNGGNRITNVAPGVNGTDAVNVNQLNAVGNRIGDVDRKARGGIAGSTAMANLPQAYIPGHSMVAVAAGTHRGANAVAVGVSRISDSGHVIIKLSGSTDSKGGTNAGVGVGYQ